MDRRRRASSATSKGLLSRQLASITDTLAKASQRRDAELKRTHLPSKTSTVETVLAPASGPELLAPTNYTDRYSPEPADAQLDGMTSSLSNSRASSDLATITSSEGLRTHCLYELYLTLNRSRCISHVQMWS